MSSNQPTLGGPAGSWPTISGYEIAAELGRGGMGVVYKAYQPVEQRFVALKLMRDSAYADDHDRARFRIETQATALMNHPHIVRVFEISEHAGCPFFTMELVEGGTLEKHLARRPLPAAQAVELLLKLAEAVHHAHERSIIHRDLKPANILLARLDTDQAATVVTPSTQDSALRTQDFALGSLVPKIADFGLAKRLDTDSTALTREGVVLGTASYMAPEQAAGRIEAIGAATDIYALGTVLYELLTGRPPFQGRLWHETLQQVLRDEPTPPRSLQAAIPEDLETICLKCLEKEPSQRYASALDLADDLRRVMAGGRISVVPRDERERLTRLAAGDGYQLGEEIGRGPRSVVYQALHGPHQQPIAVKLFTSDAASREEWDARHRRCAELAPVLAHPHIVAVQHTGWWGDRPFVALEHVPRGSLANELNGRPLALSHALKLVEQLAEVVCFIHRQGLIHGNLKPSNVLLAADDIPRVTDFQLTAGVARGGVDSSLPGLGTKAPELLASPEAEARPHTDIYGLSLILYACLTGRTPFPDQGQDVHYQVLHDEPAHPSQLNPKVPPPLDSLCCICLRKNPWRRLHRAYDMVTSLRRIREQL